MQNSQLCKQRSPPRKPPHRRPLQESLLLSLQPSALGLQTQPGKAPTSLGGVPSSCHTHGSVEARKAPWGPALCQTVLPARGSFTAPRRLYSVTQAPTPRLHTFRYLVGAALCTLTDNKTEAATPAAIAERSQKLQRTPRGLGTFSPCSEHAPRCSEWAAGAGTGGPGGLLAARLSPGLTGQQVEHELCDVAHNAGQKALQLITLGLQCWGADKGGEAGTGRIVWAMLSLFVLI